MHAPQQKPCMPPQQKPCMPPPAKTMHAPPGATMHAPPEQPRMPPLLTESQTPVKIQPSQTTFAGGNNRFSCLRYLYRRIYLEQHLYRLVA